MMAYGRSKPPYFLHVEAIEVRQVFRCTWFRVPTSYGIDSRELNISYTGEISSIETNPMAPARNNYQCSARTQSSRNEGHFVSCYW